MHFSAVEVVSRLSKFFSLRDLPIELTNLVHPREEGRRTCVLKYTVLANTCETIDNCLLSQNKNMKPGQSRVLTLAICYSKIYVVHDSRLFSGQFSVQH